LAFDSKIKKNIYGEIEFKGADPTALSGEI
jgi:hypothetical protein